MKLLCAFLIVGWGAYSSAFEIGLAAEAVTPFSKEASNPLIDSPLRDPIRPPALPILLEKLSKRYFINEGPEIPLRPFGPEQNPSVNGPWLFGTEIPENLPPLFKALSSIIPPVAIKPEQTPLTKTDFSPFKTEINKESPPLLVVLSPNTINSANEYPPNCKDDEPGFIPTSSKLILPELSSLPEVGQGHKEATNETQYGGSKVMVKIAKIRKDGSEEEESRRTVLSSDYVEGESGVIHRLRAVINKIEESARGGRKSNKRKKKKKPNRPEQETSSAGCIEDLNDFAEPDPLVLRPDVRYDDIADYEDAFILPEQKSGLLTFNTGDTFRLACPGTSLSINSKTEDIATCVGNNQYTVGSSSTKVTASRLSCKASPTNTAIRKDTCENGATGIELGFQLSNDFYPLIYTCFNEDELLTYYSKERVSAELSGYESGEDSPSFKPDDFFPGIDIDKMYTYDNQMVAFTKLLGSQSLASSYLKDRSSYFLARGHFAPRADFVYGSLTRATYHFVNVGPQWQIFNGGVWNNLEMAVRDYAIESGVDLIGYTGPWGTLSYPDINGNLVDMYLINPGTSKQTLKVSKFYWKVLYEPTTKKGVAFIGINDPFVDVPYPKDYILCDDVLDQISWINIRDTTWLYACDVLEFQQISDTFPQLDVTGLLN